MAFGVALDRRQVSGTQSTLRPMSLWLSVLLFAVPALLAAFSFHIAPPWLEAHGVSPLAAFLAALTVPVALLLAATLVAVVQIEHRPLSRAALGERLRFPRLRLRDVVWGIAIFGALLLGYGIGSAIGSMVLRQGLIPLPASIPALADPRTPLTLPVLNTLAGGTIRGRWDLALLYFVTLFLNIVGEELWWRGYILPRQELAHGRWTWLLHGLQWALFHSFKWWDLFGLLPVCLIISFSAQRLRNNWPGLLAHYLFNGIGFVVILAAVAGLG